MFQAKTLHFHAHMRLLKGGPGNACGQVQQTLTLLPMGKGSLSHTIRLSAATLKPLKVGVKTKITKSIVLQQIFIEKFYPGNER